ncbi:MAG: pyridoxal-phosphate-dependent aminotransferase family protein [Candidatus Aquicultorales bacterium]
MRKRYLMTPGPTPVPADVLLSMAEPIIHHRTPEFSAILEGVVKDLKYVFETESDVLLYACSGTGVMESAVVNCFSPGDKVVVARNGKFGDRNFQLSKTYGLEVIDLQYEWTSVVDPRNIAEALEKNPDVKGVFVTQSETSSGVLNDVKAVGEIVKGYPNAVLIVDSITGIGAVECKTDEWGLDVVMTGSQKGLMLPPGLAAVSVSQKAWGHVENSALPKFYFDWRKAKKSIEKNTTPFTPPVSLIIGLGQALGMLREEGLENVIRRHAILAEAVRAGVVALGLKLFAPPEGRGSAVTPVWVPEGVDGGKIPKIMSDKYGVTIAGGQDEYKGKIFRLGHLGYFDRFDMITTLSALEMTLKELGYGLESGTGVAAAQAVFEENPF